MRVVCVMPTSNRHERAKKAVECFAKQTYEDKHLLIIDDSDPPVPGDWSICGAADFLEPAQYTYWHLKPTVLGLKRQLGAEMAFDKFDADLVANWDDDDWHAPTRLEYQIEALKARPEKEACGLYSALFYDEASGETWRWAHTVEMVNATLIHDRRFLERGPYPDQGRHSSHRFLRTKPSSIVLPLNDEKQYVAIRHLTNTAKCSFGGPGWTKMDFDASSYWN